jgi:hypothetical protein
MWQGVALCVAIILGIFSTKPKLMYHTKIHIHCEI